MNGIDISHWQSGIELACVPSDFVIMKATEGTEFVDPCCDTFYQEAKRLGRKLGVYHFATGSTSGEREGTFFLKHVEGYIGEAILVLDWETKALQKGTGYAKEFLDYVYKNTGVRPLQYANTRKTGYQQNPWTDGKGYGAWGGPAKVMGPVRWGIRA